MLCPLCRAKTAPGRFVCASCGVDFMKWLRLQGGKASARRRRESVVPWALGAAALLVLAVLAYSLRRPPAPPPPSARPPARPQGGGPSEDRLADLYRLARAECEVHGVDLSPSDLAGRYREGLKGPGDEALAALAAELGIAPPRSMHLADGEPALHAKCRKDGAWVYGALPARPEAGVECWGAVNDRPRRWVLQHWQPAFRRWSPWTQGELERLRRRHLETAYSPQRVQAARQALVDGRDERAALREYWGLRAEREGALAAVGN